MANKGAGVSVRKNKKGLRSAPESRYFCKYCNKRIKASGLTEFHEHTAACEKLLVEARRREAMRRDAARREENN